MFKVVIYSLTSIGETTVVVATADNVPTYKEAVEVMHTYQGNSSSISAYIVSSYRVLDKVFATFEEVVKYAYNEHKIEFFYDDYIYESDRQAACEELSTLIKEDV